MSTLDRLDVRDRRQAVEGWSELRARLASFIAQRVAPSDVDDVLQDVLVRMLKGVDGVRDDERWVSWIYTLTRNAITDHHRRVGRRRQAPVELDDDAPVLAVEAPVDDAAIYGGATECVAGFLERLPATYREAIAMTELEGLSQREAATRLGMSYSGLKSRVQRGRDQLRELLTACCVVELDARQRLVDIECSASDRCAGGCSDGTSDTAQQR